MKSIHHSFDVNLAAQYGIKEAIIIHHFQHWININKRLKKNQHENRTWTYQTISYISAHFPYMSENEVREIIETLCKGKPRRGKGEPNFEPVLLKKNFNKTKFDRTYWYAFVDEEKFIPSDENSKNVYERANAQFELGKLAQMESGNCPNGKGHLPTPIPNTKDICLKKNNINAQSHAKRGHEPPEPDIFFSKEERKFKNITPQDMETWKEIYQEIDVAKEILKAAQWVIANPSKGRKKQWRRFILNWLSKSNEKAENKKMYKEIYKNKPTEDDAHREYIAEKNKKAAGVLMRKKGLMPAQLRREDTHVSVKIGDSYCPISYQENGFMEQLENALRKGGHW